MEEMFQLGIGVQLNSGGPKMTINSFNADGTIQCDWFDGTDKKTAPFNSFELHVVS